MLSTIAYGKNEPMLLDGIWTEIIMNTWLETIILGLPECSNSYTNISLIEILQVMFMGLMKGILVPVDIKLLSQDGFWTCPTWIFVLPTWAVSWGLGLKGSEGSNSTAFEGQCGVLHRMLGGPANQYHLLSSARSNDSCLTSFWTKWCQYGVLWS